MELLCGLLFIGPAAWCGWILLRGAWEMWRDRDFDVGRAPGFLPLSPKWFAIAVVTVLGLACLSPLLLLLTGVLGPTF